MARLLGVDLPKNKRMEIALTYIFGIGRASARTILKEANVEFDLKSDSLNDDQILRLRTAIEAKGKIEGKYSREITMNIKRLIDLGCYRGIRHKKGLPTRGQRTKSNARTRKGQKKNRSE